MARTVRFSQVLWMLTAAWLAACGRIGFGDGATHDAGGIGALPPSDGAVTGPGVPDAAPDAAFTGPRAQIGTTGAMTTTCAGSRAPQTLTIKNVGDRDLTVRNLRITSPQQNMQPDFTSTPATIDTTLATGDSVSFQITPREAVIGTDIGGTTLQATFSVDTNDPTLNAALQHPLTATVVGANIQIASIKPVDPKNALDMLLSSASGACPAPGTVTVKLTGASSVTIDSLNAASGFAFSGFTGGTLTSAATKTLTISLSSGSNCTTGTSVSFSASSDHVCQAPTMTVSFASGAAGCSCP